MNKQNLNAVSKQWAERPDDERFISLKDLRRSVERRTKNALAIPTETALLLPEPEEGGGLRLSTPIIESARMTNWSFGQLASTAGAPAGYLRQLPAELACANLLWGMQDRRDKEKVSLFVDASSKESPELRAITSSSYGRIYDLDVVDAVMKLNEAQDGRWVVPAASYQKRKPKRATTLYGSDRDVFMFLCDPSTPVEIPGQDTPSYRGFVVSNSEVGAGCFVLTCFLYETVCDNRIIWGTSQLQEMRLRHTSGAPERFLREARPALLEYSKRSGKAEVDRIKRAQKLRLKSAKAAGSESLQDLYGWVRQQTGLSLSQVREASKRAKEEEGQFDTAWDAVQGITALARGVTHTDQRLRMEQAAAKLLY